MKRILLSTATVALFAFGACLLFGRQECAAVSNLMVTESASQTPVMMESNVAIDLSAAEQRDRADVHLAQADAFAPSAGLKPTSVGEPASHSFKRTIKVPVTTINFVDQVVEMAEVTPLQQQYSVLMLKRAQRMSEEELKKAIEEVEAELKVQDETADAELQKAVEILNQLQENSGGTPAARRAAGALPILTGVRPVPDSGEAPTYSDPNQVQFKRPLNPVPTY